jgi:hypothetical protein
MAWRLALMVGRTIQIIDKNVALSAPLYPTDLLLYDGILNSGCCFCREYARKATKMSVFAQIRD